MQYDTGAGNEVKDPVCRERASGGAGVNGPGVVFPSMLFCLILLCVFNRALAETAVNTVESYLQSSRAAGKTANRLINEVSPYLLQHAYNPVHWYAWGDEAFELARKENKPIFLSIGYSTCHWCHVMAHESFENKIIASILNQHYISIKVDSEERPDIDAVYMSATTLINGYGGWPMTVFINHELEPFHAGVYYPPETTDGQRGLKQLLIEIQRLWQQERKRVENVADNITGIITAAGDKTGPAVSLDGDINKRALEQIKLSYDEEYGGFGYAPKFPQYGIFSFLLMQSRQEQDDEKAPGKMISTTLTAMAQGGIFDQVGGGFHRYSVDAEWRLPHFEKMLYSQALLAIAYTRLYALEKNPLHKQVAQLTLDFVLREMQSGEGGFYSALDADSERPDRPGERAEGAYYLWSDKELGKLLTAEEYDFATRYYAVEKEGNIVSDPHNEFAGLNILRVSESYRAIPVTQKQQLMLDSVNAKLFKHRQLRSRPLLDDKIITEWNGMMIAALVEAHMVFADKKYLHAAVAAAEFIHHQLIDDDGELLRRYRNRQAGIKAGLSDYAWYIHGLIDLYRVSNNRKWLDSALELSLQQDALFLDGSGGGYFDSYGKNTGLLFRGKTIVDHALPAANAVVLSNLNALVGYTGDKRWKHNAEQLLSAFAATINNSPQASAMALWAMAKR